MAARLVLVERVRRRLRELGEQLSLFVGPPEPAEADEPAPVAPPSPLGHAPDVRIAQANLYDYQLTHVQHRVVTYLDALGHQLGRDEVPASQSQLADAAGCGVRHLREQMRPLIESGRIVVVRQGRSRRQPTLWRLRDRARGPRQVAGRDQSDSAERVVEIELPAEQLRQSSAAVGTAVPTAAEPRHSAAVAAARSLYSSSSSSSSKPTPTTAEQPRHSTAGVGAAQPTPALQRRSPDHADALVLAHYPLTVPHTLDRIRGDRERAGVTDAEYSELVAAHGERLRAECRDPVLWSLRVCDRVVELRAAQRRAQSREAHGSDRTPSATRRDEQCGDCGGTGWRRVERDGVEGVQACACRRERR